MNSYIARKGLTRCTIAQLLGFLLDAEADFRYVLLKGGERLLPRRWKLATFTPSSCLIALSALLFNELMC